MMKKLVPQLLLLLSTSTAGHEVIVDESNYALAEVHNQFSTEIVDESNYALAEVHNQFRTEIIPKVKKQHPETNGVGVFAHARNVAKASKDLNKIPRPNFDTLYSGAVIDLTKPAYLTMPDTRGRYQSVLICTEEHYMPIYFHHSKAGRYEITQESMGAKYVFALGRTLADKNDEEDLKDAREYQNLLKLEQENSGSFDPSEKFDEKSLEKMTTDLKEEWNSMKDEEKPTSGDMFGKKEDGITLKNLNLGVANGIFGNPPEMAIYIDDAVGLTGPYTLTLKDVPVNAFWSVTVYNPDGFVEDIDLNYNTNSVKADEEEDGSVIINFADEKGSEKLELTNVLHTYESWTYIVRLYEPRQEVLNGQWEMPPPETKKVDPKWPKKKCNKLGGDYSGSRKVCERYDGTAKLFCKRKKFPSDCERTRFVCYFDKKKMQCKTMKCKTIKSPVDCELAVDCKYNKKKKKCKEINNRTED